MKKPKIGDLITITFSDRKAPISGLLIDYNEDWTLLKHNTVDYIIDGYVVIRHKNIKHAERGEREKFKEKIIKLKGLGPTKKELIPLLDLETILSYLTDKFDVFTLYTKSENTCYLGSLESLIGQELVISYLDPEGKWSGKKAFKPGEIRAIEFDTDYINSLKLVSKPRKQPKKGS